MRKIILASALALTALPSFAQEVTKSGGTFGQRGLGIPQATGYANLNEFRPGTNYEPMLRYVASPRLGRLINYVGYLDVLTATPDVSLQCTATLIAADRLLTNAHCVPEKGSERALKIEFTLGYLTTYDRSTERSFAASPVAIARDDLLDWAVLKLNTPVPDFVDPGFTVREPRRNEPLLVVGHPLLQPLHVTQAGCTMHPDANGAGQALYHLCDTEKGHSGSLVFSADEPTQIVGLHKKWGSDANVAIRLAALPFDKNSELSQLGSLAPKIAPPSAFAEFTLSGKRVNQIAFSADSGFLAAASGPDNTQMNDGIRQRTLTIWNIDSHEIVFEKNYEAGDLWPLEFSPDGKFLFAGNPYDKSLLRISLKAGFAVEKLALPMESNFRSLAFAPGSDSLLVAGSTTAVEVSTTMLVVKRTHDLSQRFEKKFFDGLSFSPDGRRIVVSAFDNNDHWLGLVLDSSTWQELFRITNLNGGKFRNPAFSPNGEMIMSETDIGPINFHDSQTGEFLFELGGGNYEGLAPQLSADGTYVTFEDRDLQLWSLKSRGQLAYVNFGRWGADNPRFSPDGRLIAAGSRDGKVRVWSIADLLR